MRLRSSSLTSWFAAGALTVGTLFIPQPAQAQGSFNVAFGNDDFHLSLGRYDYFGNEGFNVGFGAGGPGGYGSLSYHDVLGDYGRFTHYGPLGEVWVPYVASGWRPYTYGRWVWTEYGWTWVAYEPWGYIPHHFGRWAYTSQFGWVWVAGYQWAPAYVDFVYSNDVIGWAPLSPQGFTNYGYGQGYGHNQGYGYGPSGFNTNVFIFVNERDFGAGNCADYALGPTSVSQVIAHSRLRRSDRGPERDYIERRIGRRIEVAKVNSQTVRLDGKQVRLVTPVGVENDIRRYAPKVTQRALDQRFLQQRIEKVRRGEVRTNQEAVDRLFKQERRTDSGKRYEKGEIVHDQGGRETHRAPGKVETKPDTRSSSSSGERYEKGQVVHDQSGRETYRAPGKVETKQDDQGRANSGERYEKGEIVHDQSGREVVREPNSSESKQIERKVQAREDSRSKNDQAEDQKAGDKKQKSKKDKHHDNEPPNR